MKKHLLFIIFSVIFIAVSSQAQRVWDFGNDVTTWPTSPGVSVPTLVDDLALIPGDGVTNMGQVDNNSATWFSGTSEEYKSVQRIKLNGSGGIDPAIDGIYVPTKRYFRFAVTEACTIKLWFRLSGTGDRDLYLTDGSATIAMFPGLNENTDPKTMTATYTGGAGNIYIFGAKNSFNIYKIEVSPSSAVGPGVLLGINDVVSAVETNIRSVRDRIYIYNTKTPTEVKIYSITGALLKEFTTNSDTDFNFKSGIYIATLKTAEGQKSVKISTY